MTRENKAMCFNLFVLSYRKHKQIEAHGFDVATDTGRKIKFLDGQILEDWPGEDPPERGA